jgi:hypothetical protein
VTPFTRAAVPVYTVATDGLELEYSVDQLRRHERIERMLFDGALEPIDGMLRPDVSPPGPGLERTHADARRHAA